MKIRLAQNEIPCQDKPAPSSRTKTLVTEAFHEMKNRIYHRLEEVTGSTLIVGMDVAKSVCWARFADFRGVDHNEKL